MNIRRFTARTSRDALVLARQALGDDAVVLSTKPSPEGVEVLAMAPEGMQQIERMTARAPLASAAPTTGARAEAASPIAATARQEPAFPTARDDTAADVARLSMSTLSFQDYVRERMLRRRQEAMNAEAPASSAAGPSTGSGRTEMGAGSGRPEMGAASGRTEMGAASGRTEIAAASGRTGIGATQGHGAARSAHGEAEPDHSPRAAAATGAPVASHALPASHHDLPPREPPLLREALAPARDLRFPGRSDPAVQAPHLHALEQTAPRESNGDMLAELRAVKGLIEERFGALAYIEKLNRQPGQVRLIQKLLGCGYSPALIKKIGDSLPMDAGDETLWAAGVLERNLLTAEAEPPLEDLGGVYALVGATGVGKTTTTAKIAAAFATKYGAANLGLITLDAYRLGAHEQLRAYGRILGVPVHTAHDRASLEDLLELLAGKKMVLIDTAGMAQRDTRTRELLEMISHRVVKKLLVVNAASQGETIEDVMIAYHAPACAGLVLSKMDEAVKLGPALDAAIRMKLKIVGVANGQRVPEDWHRLSGNALVTRSLRAGGSSAYRLDAGDISLVFTAPAGPRFGGEAPAAARMPLPA